MSLLLRVNLALVVVFALAASITGLACRTLLQRSAQREIGADAELMMDSALAVRDYTDSEIAPLLAQQLQSVFLQEAILNPTNLHDRATDWQADIIQRFRNDAGVHEISGERDIGPVARHLVNRAAARGAGADALIRELGAEIESEADRRVFRSASRQAPRGRS